MDEFFLQFLWKFQKFESNTLTLTNEQLLIVFDPGYQNDHAGPDFREAKIKIDELVWSGSVEIHFKSSDWDRHHHSVDKAYDNVVLHVVWKHDQEILINNQAIPTLELSRYVSNELESAYRKYINQPETIRCCNYLKEMPTINISAMIDRALASRLQQKSQLVMSLLREMNNNWEETTYRMLARNFGFKTNAEPFERLANALPYSVIRKHQGYPVQVDALIFGMAGYLEDAPSDKYQEKLTNEFGYLKQKYQLDPVLMRYHWKNARMRPANFPTVRLAQFSALLAGHGQLFAKLIAAQNLQDTQSIVKQPLPLYWQEHYDFGKPSSSRQSFGKSSLENILINSVAPILAAYAKFLDELQYLERAQALLEQLPSEVNSITKKWINVGVLPDHAADSQALIYQYREFCMKKRCLNCNIGISVLNKTQ